ncbi:MAG: NAD(P)-dependent oxidoreductase [Rubrivivax sp.]|nr:NAD(P)-dependent oxidoreductase [Rubrivivax sp.]
MPAAHPGSEHAADGIATSRPPGHGTHVGLVGLGLVGTALGTRLARAGFTVLGHDSREEARAQWRGAGGEVGTSLRALGATCECVVLAVFDTAGVLEVIEGPGGLLEGGATRAVVDCSTGDPEALQALAARLATRGVTLVEAPLSGSSQQIAEGAATMLLGGEATALRDLAAVLEALSPRRIHVGGAGMGARAKLATNLVLGLNRAVLAEGLVYAERLGIAPATFLELVLATPARSDAALAKGARMVQGDFAPQSRIHQHLKDVRLMLAGAEAAGQRLPLTETHAALLQAAVASGDGDLDNAAIVRQLRREVR